MASESSESSDEKISLSLPPDLAEWVDERAAEHGTDRQTVLVQLLAAYRATEDVEDGAVLDPGGIVTDDSVEREVRDVVAERIPDIAGAVANRLDVDRRVEEALEDERSDLSRSAAEEATDRVQGQLEEVREDYTAKLEDVRERVIQVKKETDRKAPAEHGHPDLVDRVNSLAADVEQAQSEIQSLREDLEGRYDSQDSRLDDLDETVWDMQEKLRTVAWVVNDLREGGELDTKRAASVDQIKHAAAGHDVDRARCEACGQGVEIALMTAPECPHCEATVNDVEPGSGLFGKPTLVKARGIEAAEDADS